MEKYAHRLLIVVPYLLNICHYYCARRRAGTVHVNKTRKKVITKQRYEKLWGLFLFVVLVFCLGVLLFHGCMSKGSKLYGIKEGMCLWQQLSGRTFFYNKRRGQFKHYVQFNHISKKGRRWITEKCKQKTQTHSKSFVFNSWPCLVQEMVDKGKKKKICSDLQSTHPYVYFVVLQPGI